MQGLIRIVLCAAIGVAGCGSESGGGGGGGQGGMGGYGVELPTAESLYPQKVGNSWTYLVTPMAVELPSYKVVRVDAMGMVEGQGTSAGRPAFRHTTCKSAPTPEACNMAASATNRIDKNIGWMGMNDKALINYREQAFRKATDVLVEEDWWEPGRLKVDMNPARTVAGATWTEKYKEFKHPTGGAITATNHEEKWTVVAAAETVTITPPTGAARTYPNCIKVTHDNPSGTKTFWYARGIGKVKETGPSQMEELLDYKVLP